MRHTELSSVIPTTTTTIIHPNKQKTPRRHARINNVLYKLQNSKYPHTIHIRMIHKGVRLLHGTWSRTHAYSQQRANKQTTTYPHNKHQQKNTHNTHATNISSLSLLTHTIVYPSFSARPLSLRRPRGARWFSAPEIRLPGTSCWCVDSLARPPMMACFRCPECLAGLCWRCGVKRQAMNMESMESGSEVTGWEDICGSDDYYWMLSLSLLVATNIFPKRPRIVSCGV